MADFAPWQRKRIEAAEEFFKSDVPLAMASCQMAQHVLWLADQAVPVVPVERVERADEGEREQQIATVLGVLHNRVTVPGSTIPRLAELIVDALASRSATEETTDQEADLELPEDGEPVTIQNTSDKPLAITSPTRGTWPGWKPRDDGGGVILYDESALSRDNAGELASAGLLVRCSLDTYDDPDPPCGFQHRGERIYHLAPGVDVKDLR